MHLYDRTWINRAGLRVPGWTKDTPNPFVGMIERDASGNPTGLLVATIGLPALLGRFAVLGGSIKIQNRMSADGEAFLTKYEPQAAADAPPIARIREMGIPMAAGTVANRANTYNPWIGVHWLITGKTLGGPKLNGDRNLLDRTEAPACTPQRARGSRASRTRRERSRSASLRSLRCCRLITSRFPRTPSRTWSR